MSGARRREDAFIDLPWLAQRAERLCVYHPSLIPQPVRTPEYHQLVARLLYPTDWLPAQSERHRELRAALASTSTMVEAVVDESALCQAAWGTEVLRLQLVRLLELRLTGQMQILVLPRDVPHEGPLWLFEMPFPYPPVGYLDDVAGQHYVELPHVQRFVDAYQQLSEAALDLPTSTRLIEKRVTDLS